MADESGGDFCGARSKLSSPSKPKSYFICTRNAGHPDGRHTACDGQGHVVARWRSETSPVEVWGPLGGEMGMSAADDRLTAALEEIRGREQAATPGPWWSDEDDRMWRLHGVHGVVPAQLDGLIPEQAISHQILKAPKWGTPYAEYWPNAADAAFIVAARTDVPRLLAALDAVLRLHQPRQLYGFIADENHPDRCPHDADGDWDQHFEGDDGMWYCHARPTAQVCTSCADGPDGDTWAEWPCPTYKAITRELTGEGK